MLFSMASMQVNIISRSWLAYHISGSAFALGLVAMARGLPQLVLSPWGGVAADRFDKQKLLLASQCSLAVLAVVNAVLVQLNVIQVWQLVVLGLFQGVVFPFTMPARQAMIPAFVGEKRVPNAFALDSAGRNLNRVLGPSVAGVLLAWDPVIAFYTIAGLYVASALFVARLPSVKESGRRPGTAYSEFLAAFHHAVRHPRLSILMPMAFIVVILGLPLQQFLPTFQIEVLHVGPTQLGWMYTAIGVGALVGSFAMAVLASSPRRAAIQMVMGVGFGLALAAFAFSSVLLASLAALVVLGFASESYMTINRVEVVVNTEPEMRGRILGIYVMTWAVMPIASLPIGAIVDALGPGATFIGAGFLMALILAAIAVARPSVWRYRPATT